MLVKVRIEGISSLLQHRFSEEAEGDVGKATRKVNVTRGTPREEAERVAYRWPNGEMYHPSQSVFGLICEAGRNHKQKGSRRSLKYVVPATIVMCSDTMKLLNKEGNPITDFEVDSRPVVIPSTKGRIMRHRPRLDEWVAEFDMEIDEDVLPAETIQQLLTEGGRKIGIGDFRPERFGPFGRFMVVDWSEIQE
jgi:hypothetical protein